MLKGESLRTLDKYNGPIDGNLQSEATMKAIGEWQKGRNTPVVGKLTPQEAQQLNAEAAKAPIRRIEPPPQTAAAPATPGPSSVGTTKACKAALSCHDAQVNLAATSAATLSFSGA